MLEIANYTRLWGAALEFKRILGALCHSVNTLFLIPQEGQVFLEQNNRPVIASKNGLFNQFQSL